MPKFDRPTSVPKGMQATYEAITTLTDAFCRDHLNDEYRELAQRMTAALCRKRPSPVVSGQPRTWACSIIYHLGQINFLSDLANHFATICKREKFKSYFLDCEECSSVLVDGQINTSVCTSSNNVAFLKGESFVARIRVGFHRFS